MKRAAERVHDIRREEVKGGGDGEDHAEGDGEERFSCKHDRSIPSRA
jgi:hypothetical protein